MRRVAVARIVSEVVIQISTRLVRVARMVSCDTFSVELKLDDRASRGAGQLPQLVVDQRQELLCRARIARFDLRQDSSDVDHDVPDYTDRKLRHFGQS